MTITELNIVFDQQVFYPGEMIKGYVTVTLDRPKKINGIELKIKGRAKLKWTETERNLRERRHGESRNNWEYKTVTHVGKECYLVSVNKLVGSTSNLNVGQHTYQFAAMLPVNVPSTFNSKFGGVAYYAKVKVDVPLQPDRTVKKFFKVENPLDLNHFPNLKTSAKLEKSKTFCCLCCTSGPLTMVVYVPRTGYADTESIPITVEIDNASNVCVNSVTAMLTRRIHWKAQRDNKQEKVEIKKLSLGEVAENSSKTWSKSMLLDCGPFRNITHCNIMSIAYQLEVVADPSGAHTDLVVEIPLIIGNIPFHEREGMSAPNAVQLPVAQSFPQQVENFVPFNGNCPQPSPGFNAGGVMPTPYPSAPGAYASVSHPSVSGGSAQGSFYAPNQSSPSAPSFLPYPSTPHMPPTFDGRQPNLGGPTAHNPALGFPGPNPNPPAPPFTQLPSSYPHGASNASSGFYDPSASRFG